MASRHFRIEFHQLPTPYINPRRHVEETFLSDGKCELHLRKVLSCKNDKEFCGNRNEVLFWDEYSGRSKTSTVLRYLQPFKYYVEKKPDEWKELDFLLWLRMAKTNKVIKPVSEIVGRRHSYI
ncbi:10499_t:CDS:2 [Ambispora gerdemannii]|uniref:10499_t:CDS:1 n=1 Tax=Ambispora gerdemannii TaxID=144530 RepID=A0A9N8V3Y0_9GLOM|nr:10499_t:CDS:2 [Ambispora gerdemannii]